MDHNNAAVMLAQLQSNSQGEGSGKFDPRMMSSASMMPMAYPPQMTPHQWAAACAWGTPPSMWPMQYPYMAPQMLPPTAQAMSTIARPVATAAAPSSQHYFNEPARSTAAPAKRSIDSAGDSGDDSTDDPHRKSGGPHSGTQRRPTREDYEDEAEYCAAYHRWRQVRDRNNDAVKRSREKYKAKKRSTDAVSRREQDLRAEVSKLKAHLALFAKALRAPAQLTLLEQASLNECVSAWLPSPMQPSLAPMCVSISSATQMPLAQAMQVNGTVVGNLSMAAHSKASQESGCVPVDHGDSGVNSASNGNGDSAPLSPQRDGPLSQASHIKATTPGPASATATVTPDPSADVSSDSDSDELVVDESAGAEDKAGEDHGAEPGAKSGQQ